MPKQTFFNLPEAKRKAILDAAIEEFAKNDYQNASISQVVATVNIAKGSFYQYFEDKRDLYFYLLDLAFQAQITFVQETLPFDPAKPFFDYLEAVLEVGVRFNFAQPRLSQIIYRAMFGELPFRDETLLKLRESSLEFVRQTLRQGIVLGEINPDIDVEMIAYMLNLITSDFGNFLVMKLGITPQQLMDGDYTQIDTAALHDTFAKATTFLRDGLANRYK